MKFFRASCIILSVLCCSVARPATLTGRIVDETGEPVAGAKVWLYRFVWEPEVGFQVIATATSAEDGSFSLDDPDVEVGTERDKWYVYAYQPGLALDSVETTDASQALELRLTQPRVISGRLLGEGGKPLVGATVRISDCTIGQHGAVDYRRFFLSKELAEQLAARTDETGHFELRATPKGSRSDLSIIAEGYGSLHVSSTVDLSVLRLEPAGSISGRVVGADDPAAAAGTELRLHGEIDAHRVSAFARATTDAEGRFSAPELVPGIYRLSARGAPEALYHVRGKEGVEVKSREETVIELTAERTALVTGRVVADDTGEGLPGAALSLNQSEPQYYTSGKTDEEGRFEIRCLPGKTHVYAHLTPGYALPREEGPLMITVEPGGAALGDIRLVRLQELMVVVVDEEEQPVEGAIVRVEPEGRGWSSEPGLTDGNGIFRTKGLQPGAVTVRAHKGQMAAEPQEVTVGKDTVTVRLVLKGGAVAGVTAIVVDQHNEPVLDATVFVHETRPVGEHTRETSRLTCEPPDAAEGRVGYIGLRPGLDYRLDVSAPNCDETETEAWTAEEGVVHDFGIIRMTRHEGVVAGVVVGEGGEPVAGATVLDAWDAPRKLTTATDEDGRFRLEGLAEGSVWLLAESPEHSLSGVRAQTGDENVRIVLKPEQPATMGQPPVRPQPTMPLAEAKELAKKLLAEVLEQTRWAQSRDRARLLTALAKLDPEAAYQAAADGGDDACPIDFVVGCGLLTEDFDKAVTLMRQGEEARRVVLELLQRARGLAEGNPQLAVRCLDEAVQTAFEVNRDGDRMAYQAQAAYRLTQLNDSRGVELLREIAAAAEKSLGTTGREAYNRGVIAQSLCEQDVEAALALIDPLVDLDAQDRHLANIARHVAKNDPDRALEILASVTSERYRERAVCRVVPLLPAEHLDRALELIRGISEHMYRARALTRLSQVAPADQVPALIGEATDALVQELGRYGYAGGGREDVAKALASVACVARRLGYQQYESIALKAASFHGRRQGGYVDTGLNIWHDLELAQVLAFTVPEVARQIIESALAAYGGLDEVHPRAGSRLGAAAVEADVRWALELMAQMCADDIEQPDLRRASALAAVVSRLVESPQEREDELLTSDSWGPWLIVDEDF